VVDEHDGRRAVRADAQRRACWGRPRARCWADDDPERARCRRAGFEHKNHELLTENVFEELRNGWLSWGKGIEDAALKNIAWGIAAEIVYAFDVQWSPDWVAKGHPHRWHDEDGWHARCNDCLDESPAESDEAVAYAWFADHRPVAHGDTAPPFRPSPPAIAVPMPNAD
jgi:hypothetical protein